MGLCIICGHPESNDECCRNQPCRECDKLKARVERYERALKDILNPHPHGIAYTWQGGHIINGRVKKCHAIEMAKQALAEQEGK